MKIEVLGTGCAKCRTLLANALRAVEMSGREAEVVKVEDIPSIVRYGILSTPALVVDGVVKFSGRVASPEEIRRML